MDTNKKTIQINPELFKINGGNTTRKKHSPKNRDKIRMKTQEKKPKKMSTIKKNILRMIQEQQHERKKTLEEDKDEILIPKSTSSSLSQKFKNEFDESLLDLPKDDYINAIADPSKWGGGIEIKIFTEIIYNYACIINYFLLLL